jgi:hypothetical protein
MMGNYELQSDFKFNFTSYQFTQAFYFWSIAFFFF